mmetsp:Transcript_66906/g.114980  ORF Transcript_66906/g.114980 Transcript_66906/m.114980 type:complete len:229 (-) Transcript_66906:146-832(-)
MAATQDTGVSQNTQPTQPTATRAKVFRGLEYPPILMSVLMSVPSSAGLNEEIRLLVSANATVAPALASGQRLVSRAPCEQIKHFAVMPVFNVGQILLASDNTLRASRACPWGMQARVAASKPPAMACCHRMSSWLVLSSFEPLPSAALLRILPLLSSLPRTKTIRFRRGRSSRASDAFKSLRAPAPSPLVSHPSNAAVKASRSGSRERKQFLSLLFTIPEGDNARLVG